MKKLFIIVMILALTLSLTACSGESVETEIADADEVETEVITEEVEEAEEVSDDDEDEETTTSTTSYSYESVVKVLSSSSLSSNITTTTTTDEEDEDDSDTSDEETTDVTEEIQNFRIDVEEDSTITLYYSETGYADETVEDDAEVDTDVEADTDEEVETKISDEIKVLSLTCEEGEENTISVVIYSEEFTAYLLADASIFETLTLGSIESFYIASEEYQEGDEIAIVEDDLSANLENLASALLGITFASDTDEVSEDITFAELTLASFDEISETVAFIVTGDGENTILEINFLFSVYQEPVLIDDGLAIISGDELIAINLAN